MHDHGDGSIGYGGEEARLVFLKAAGRYEQRSNDAYWKIALAVPNIEIAYQQLSTRGIQVSEPGQFQDVGYLAKITDPEGFIIELIDHWFKGNRPDEKHDQTLFGGGAHFNLLTLRTADIDAVRKYCANCGMTVLSILPVENHGFTFYFFAFTANTPPSSDPYSVSNREWLYQRKYTVLEVQHVHNACNMLLPASGLVGYAGTMLSGLSDERLYSDLLIGPYGELKSNESGKI